MKLYRLSKKNSANGYIYSWYSLLNSCKGCNYSSKDEAIENAEEHQLIMVTIHPELKSLVKE